MKKLLILISVIGLCYCECLPIDNVTTLTGWFNEWRVNYQHKALDIPANAYTPVKSVTLGTVVRCDWDESLGNFVEVMDVDGMYRYCHLQNYTARVGDVVQQGQVIGSVGNTGKQRGSNRPMGSHLHLERWEDGVKVYFTNRFKDQDGNRIHWTIR